MNKIIERGILYDYYGDLLTEHQREIYEDAVYNDLSLNEIAQEQGISKQGVHDLISRCTKTMEGYESKLHLIEQSEKLRESAKQLMELAEEVPEKEELISRIRQIAQQLN